jgi:adenylate cyclase
VLLTGKTLAQTGARFDVAPLGERLVRSEKLGVFELLNEDVEDSTFPGGGG